MKAGKDQDLDQELDIKSVLQYIKRKQLLNQINDFSAKIQKVDTSLGGVAFLTIPFTFLHCLLLPFTLFVASFELFTLDGLQCSKSQTQTTRYRTQTMKQHELTYYH